LPARRIRILGGAASAEHTPSESEIFRRAEEDTPKQRSEEPASMREVVLAQIDDGVPGYVWQDQRRDHVYADRLQHDDEERHKGPICSDRLD
jgi:hypothetical protein